MNDQDNHVIFSSFDRLSESDFTKDEVEEQRCKRLARWGVIFVALTNASAFGWLVFELLHRPAGA